MQRQQKLCIIGDSLVCGVGRGDGIDSRFELLLKDFTVQSQQSRPGLAAADISNPFVSLGSFNITFIELGANDLLRGYSAVEFSRNYRRLMMSIRVACPNGVIIAANVPNIPVDYRRLSADMPASVLAYNDVIMDIVNIINARQLDLYTFTKNLESRTDLVSEDALHPNAGGYGMLFDFFSRNIRDVARRHIGGLSVL